MTKPHYPSGCSVGSKDCGIASSPGDYAWNVNFNNGNSNYNNQNNEGFVRAVRARECPGVVSFRDLHTAWRSARRAKKPSANQLTFDSYWMDGLLDLQSRLDSATWEPAPSTCFIAKLPKAREIHAPDFSDRIVHHWIIPQLEAIYERTFIHDSYSNRVGKGTHAAVDRLKTFIRQVHSGQGGGFYLQLDIKNFFNSIHRPTLYAMLKTRMLARDVPEVVRRTVHSLLRRSATETGVHHVSSPAELDRVPAHKRLENSEPGCGLAIGNLSSQFFANVYLDALDQFVKHGLKAQRYLRYVDDFVLVHASHGQLQAWQAQIEAFLRERLRLELKADIKLKPFTAGCDFLGYVIHPTHSLVRRRVIGHARQKLSAWGRAHVRGGTLRTTPAELEQLRSVWHSYEGHFAHANSRNLIARLDAEFPWLRSALVRRRFSHSAQHQRVSIKSSP